MNCYFFCIAVWGVWEHTMSQMIGEDGNESEDRQWAELEDHDEGEGECGVSPSGSLYISWAKIPPTQKKKVVGSCKLN
jgi:hypothetical protein